MSSHHDDDDEPTMHPDDNDLGTCPSETPWFQAHAFHLNLPPQFLVDDPSESDNVGSTTNAPLPGVTRFAVRKAREIVELALSINIQECMFECEVGFDSANNQVGENVNPTGDMDDQDEMELEVDNDTADENNRDAIEIDPTINPRLLDVHRKCARLNSQLTNLESLKCCGISQLELCQIVLHLLRLVTATISYDRSQHSLSGDAILESAFDRGTPKIHYENVGYILTLDETQRQVDDEPTYTIPETEQQLEVDLQRDFALPFPSREILLLILSNILSKKRLLRSVSNASLYTECSPLFNRYLMILEWKVFLRVILRTAPYLDEHKPSKSPIKNANSRHSIVLKRTVQLCRDARHFFEQGIRPPGYTQPTITKLDKTSNDIWDMVSSDVLFHSHTHACYRGTILLYLFQPSRCSLNYYLKVLPLWWKAWTNIDRCPEYDYLWLTLFCRARKYVPPDSYDWSLVRRRLLTHCQYWFQLPIGGTSHDKSFPRAGSPRSRSCPTRLKVFAGSASSYEEAIGFIAKVTNLLVSCLGTGVQAQHDSITISEGTNDILRFLSFVTPYFNPSNLGSWTFALGAFLHYFAYYLSCRVGVAGSFETLSKSFPNLIKAAKSVQPGSFCLPIPPAELVRLIDTLLPLCKQALYSKNGHVGRAGEAAMLYLVQIDPAHTAPAFLDFASCALDITAVNLSHQAPAAISALSRLIQPVLRNDPMSLLSRLPEILRLTLAGIDSNDQNKTIRTLVFYRSLTSWLPVGENQLEWKVLPMADISSAEQDGTMKLGFSRNDSLQNSRCLDAYSEALGCLSIGSLMNRENITANQDEATIGQIKETATALSEWSLEFLDRIFGLLRASGEREKAGTTSSGIANRHSNADVNHARNFSRVLKETLLQLFCAMDSDTHKLATRTVCRFLQEESLPSAAKDASLLCQAVGAAIVPSFEVGSSFSCSPGLDVMIAVLTDDLEHHSTKTLTYRLRCLAGAVKYSSHSIIKHKEAIASAIRFALASQDRHVFKTGCKLLRHTLFTLSESYPMASDNRPRTFQRVSNGVEEENARLILGRSAQLSGDPVRWHVPDGACIDFAWELLNVHVVQRLEEFYTDVPANNHLAAARSKLLNTVEINELRRFLRVIRYSLRGSISLLLDDVDDKINSTLNGRWGDFVPYEKSVRTIISYANGESKNGLRVIRSQLCSFVVVMTSIISSETIYADSVTLIPENDPYRKLIPAISSDHKVCKEVSDISLLLLTRRGASFRSQEAKTVWKTQKQAATDFLLMSKAVHIAELMQSAALKDDATLFLYKDGEDGGKTMTRRLLVSRVQIFHDSLQRHASFEIPRRLRRLMDKSNVNKSTLFSGEADFAEMMKKMEIALRTPPSHPLDTYESMTDGLYSLCCHSNTEVRALAISSIDYVLTRFGWMVSPRIPRLLSGLALGDHGMNGKFGVPCCADLVKAFDQQGKRKRLAEAVKGICSILSLSRSMKVILQSHKLRLQFCQTICGTDNLISLLPPEEMQKLVHYFHAIFSPFRSKIYDQPRITKGDVQNHRSLLMLALDILSEKKPVVLEATNEESERGAAHWRKLLIACWFLMTFVDEEDLSARNCDISDRIWSTCFRLIETETGQPLQRVALGLFGRLVSISSVSTASISLLSSKMVDSVFCNHYVKALVFDHKEDTSVGGGHNAQWAVGVEDIIRDAARNVAPRTLFPFQRTSQASGSFKASHAQLTEAILSAIDKESAALASKILLSLSNELAAAPPSEDQRNEQVTSAEIIAGVCRSFLRSDGSNGLDWENTFLPVIEEVVVKVPFSLTAAYFDMIRYALQYCSASSFLPLTSWIVEKIRTSLWQPVPDSNGSDLLTTNGVQETNAAQGTDGFTAQSKWLYLFTAVIIELDETDARRDVTASWYVQQLVSNPISPSSNSEPEDVEASWQLVSTRLLPTLLAALGHPFDSCRDHISRSLFRICYCHRKSARVNASKEANHTSALSSLDNKSTDATNLDPGVIVVDKLASLLASSEMSFIERYNALSTAKRFMSYCVHLGEAQFEYSDYVIPLLPLAFEALKSTVENELEKNVDGTPEEKATKRALETEIIKSFRFTIAEISVTAVISYGKTLDISKVLSSISLACKHDTWQIRHAGIHFLRCFEGAHKFMFTFEQYTSTMEIVANLLADDRREISSAAMAALTGILSALPYDDVAKMVNKYSSMASRSKMKRAVKRNNNKEEEGAVVSVTDAAKESTRSLNQKTAVYFLCGVIMAQPYDTPPYIPIALAAISKHSFEKNAPLAVRDAVKRCCAEYKRTHMSDNWNVHRAVFTDEQLEALEDVVSSPHYYA